MATDYILGPSIENHVEPEPAPATPGRVGIEFHSTPTEAGGKVHVKLSAATSPTDKRPTFIHAVFVNPPAAVPTGSQKTAQWFMQSGHPKNSVAVPQPPADASSVMTVTVPGVKPGVHHLQTILEYQT